MKKRFLSYLVDPLSGNGFKLMVFDEEFDHVSAGLLVGSDAWYPIINGVPRILIKELRLTMLQSRQQFFRTWKDRLSSNVATEWQEAINRIEDMDRFMVHQKKTAESFAFEWKKIYRENNYEKQNFLHFLSPYITEKDLKGQITLDIGCGSGRFTKQAALAGAEVAFGTDLGESVEVAYALTKDVENTCIIQADIYAMPFQKSVDIAYSIGVLHHLPEPEHGFQALIPVLKKGGRMLIWVYSRRNNARAIYFYEPLRSVMKHLPPKILLLLCYPFAVCVHGINGFTRLFNRLHQPALAKKIPFSYYANFPFNMKLNDAFDVLATPKSNYYFLETIVGWFKRAKLSKVTAFEHPEAGITCYGIDEQ